MSEGTHMGDGSLVIASNRLPFSFRKGRHGIERRRSSGGLVSALDPVLRKRGGAWVGWPGGPVPREAAIGEPSDPYRIVPVPLGPREEKRYYHGLSNGALWPLFHSLPGRATFDPRDWTAYEAVNERFAEALLGEARAGELLWVHDYHLMLVPERVRERRPKLPILFFLHVPFPSYDIFTLVPHHEELLRGVLGSRVIGLHIPGYVKNFLDCAERCLGAAVDRERGLLEFEGRTVRVGAFPIGIDWADFEAKALQAPSCDRPERLIIGADRLDYTKGIPQRIEAMERLLERHPEYREKVTLLQVAVPSRTQVPEYRALKCEIDEVVGRVNGRFATSEWSPIHYLYRSLDHAKLAGLYREADVALVTPLRDGMNLVAKEFVACQVADPGVLVLSRLAGAADGMPEALLVNPYDIEGTAQALHRALSMPRAERARRMEALRRRDAEHDVHAWVDSLLHAAAKAARA
jgi:trehalose 6-phosphate synthase/phosphatase